MNEYKKSAQLQPQPQTRFSDAVRLPSLPSRFSSQIADENIERTQHLANWKYLATTLSQKLDKNNQGESATDQPESSSGQDQQSDSEKSQLQEDERFLQEVLRSLRKLNGRVQIR